MKRALIFDPYLDTLGGGERYSLFTAQTLANSGYRVEIAWPDREFLDKAQARFGFDLSSVKPSVSAFRLLSKKSSLLSKFFFTRRYDLIFWVSDGSLPFLFSANNLVHFQIPFTAAGSHPLLNRLKINLIHKFVYNSAFTQNVIEATLTQTRGKGIILYPPIDVDSFRPMAKKENLIVSVGRFDSPSHSKRQDILIDAFKRLHKKDKSFSLVLAGGVKGEAGKKYVETLKGQIRDLPVKFITNVSFDKLKKLYASSKIFWHAAGFGIDDSLNPEKVEHFGMSTVEAMAAGCVPIVANKGGQKEIITQESGFLWDKTSQLVQLTLNLIQEPKLLKKLSAASVKTARQYSQSSFSDKLRAII